MDPASKIEQRSFVWMPTAPLITFTILQTVGTFGQVREYCAKGHPRLHLPVVIPSDYLTVCVQEGWLKSVPRCTRLIYLCGEDANSRFALSEEEAIIPSLHTIQTPDLVHWCLSHLALVEPLTARYLMGWSDRSLTFDVQNSTTSSRVVDDQDTPPEPR